jgi:uncharacterized membrane protein YgdD (TMEM256/DUF423 family)
MNKSLFRIGCWLAAISVIAGAFGAHWLKTRIDVTSLATFETAARYQMYHSLALILLSLCYDRFNPERIIWVSRLFVCGFILFCGSLYLLSLSSPHLRWVGAITPLGGMSFICAWFLWSMSLKSAIENGQ